MVKLRKGEQAMRYLLRVYGSIVVEELKSLIIGYITKDRGDK